MPTSVCCQRTSQSRLAIATAYGFTLLEALVTLAVIALLAGLVLPGIAAWVGASERATHEAQFRSAIASLPLRAYAVGRPMLIRALGEESGAAEPALASIALPPAWVASFEPPLRVSGLGLCSDAQGRVRTPDGERAFRVEGPDCRVLLGT